MASITEVAQSIDIEIIKGVGWLLNDTIIYGLVLLGLILIGERRRNKQMKLVLSLALATAIGLMVKEGMAYYRPCTGEDWCPDSYSFPSIHSIVAFTLMTGFIRKRSYPYYLLFALFVAFTRLNIGVHIFQDIVAALPIALLSYYITWIVVKDERGD